MDQEKIGKFIAEKRKAKDITQKEFAEMLNVTDKTVSRWENGHYLPDVSLFKNICEILGIEIMELLNGENNINNKKEVEKTIMNIIDMSDKDKKKKLNKILKISGIVICFIVIVSGIIFAINRMKINKLQKEIETYKQSVDKKIQFPYRVAYQEKEDGWVCSFNMEYMKDNLDVPYYYGYECDNMKYQYIDGFNYIANKPEGADYDFYSYEPYMSYPNYTDNKDYLEETILISDFFSEKKFTNKIEEKDLEDLKISKIKKTDVVELFNKAISSELVTEYGNYRYIEPVYLNESRVRKSKRWYGRERDYKFLLGYISYGGYIYYVNIDLMIDDEHLSDIVNSGKATDDQKALYDEMKSVQKAIIDKQSFGDSFESYVHPALGPLQDNIYLIEMDQKDEQRGSVYSYVW